MRLGVIGLTAFMACVPVLVGQAKAEVPLSLTTGADVPTLAPLLKKGLPAVVRIDVKGPVVAGSTDVLDDPMFREMFGGTDVQAKHELHPAGSGVIIRARGGFIVTGSHVIENADEIYVTLADGRMLKASLVGTDPDTDVAVISIPADGLTEMPFGNSENLEVGDFVVAIGNPFGFGQTVTSGIVSAVRRSGLGLNGYEEFIQTDAAINPGNSVGALMNLRGQLVGINAAIAGPNGGNAGIGFAIPSSIVEVVADQLIRSGSIHHGEIGIAAETKPGLSGAVIVAIAKGSAADSAGLKTNDRIIAIDGDLVRDSTDLEIKLGMHQAGQAAELKFVRGAVSQTVSVGLRALAKKVLDGGSINALLDGATLGTAGSGIQKNGMAVLDVQVDSKAWSSGLRKGDLVTAVNGEVVTGPDDFTKLMQAAPKQLALNITRDGSPFFLLIK